MSSNGTQAILSLSLLHCMLWVISIHSYYYSAVAMYLSQPCSRNGSDGPRCYWKEVYNLYYYMKRYITSMVYMTKTFGQNLYCRPIRFFFSVWMDELLDESLKFIHIKGDNYNYWRAEHVQWNVSSSISQNIKNWIE